MIGIAAHDMAGQVGDHRFILHADPVAAARTPFGGMIAPIAAWIGRIFT